MNFKKLRRNILRTMDMSVFIQNIRKRVKTLETGTTIRMRSIASYLWKPTKINKNIVIVVPLRRVLINVLLLEKRLRFMQKG